jgi:ketosteroid isomerase-like protein
MRRLFAVLLLTLVYLAPANAQATAGGKGDAVEETKQQVLRSEDQLNQALRENDGDHVSKMCADELEWTNANGVLLTKDQMFADLRSGKQKNNSIEHQDVRAHVYGTTVVVTGLSTSTYLYNGKTHVGSRRFTNVWIKQSGRWLLIVHHVTPVAES